MITHEEFINLIDLRNRLSNDGNSKIYEEDYLLLDIVLDDIEQQEKKDKLLELYREKDTLSKNPYKNIDTKEIKPYYEWACELKTLEDKIKELEEDLTNDKI